MIYNENYEPVRRKEMITEMNEAKYIHNLDVMSNDVMVENEYRKFRLEREMMFPVRYIKVFSKLDLNINNDYIETYYQI